MKNRVQPLAATWRKGLDAAATVARCGAKTRAGRPCRAPVVRGKGRCRMHGGAPGSGAPLGNKNRLVHGRYTREAIAERRFVRELLREARATLKQVDELT